MHPYKYRFVFFPLSFYERDVFRTVAFLNERYGLEIAVSGGEFGCNPFDDYAFPFESVPYKVGYRNYFKVELACHFQKLRQACHCSVLVHYLHKDAPWLHTGHTRKVYYGFGMPRPSENAFGLCPEREYMARTAEIFRLCIFVDKRT